MLSSVVLPDIYSQSSISLYYILVVSIKIFQKIQMLIFMFIHFCNGDGISQVFIFLEIGHGRTKS